MTLVGTSWSGWGFAHPTYTTNINGLAHTFEYYPNAAAINSAPTAQLRDIPVFRHNPSGMFTNAIPTATRDEILARGIPALSGAAGRTLFSEQVMNSFDMNSDQYKNGWGRDGYPYFGRWLHSDLKTMAFLYTHKLFEGLVEKGELR